MSFTNILHGINLFLAENLFYALLGVLLLNILQRRQRQTSARKRMATFYISVLILVWMIGTILIVHFNLPDMLQLPLLAVLIYIGWRYRTHTFPFRRYCANCGQALSGGRILHHDANLCETCEPDKQASSQQN